ncbi:GNAT family N-acetyltransferase [Listeria rocourtiae]|uniref:GNAT family N-acetyltransferase n=1 Tax=Listeria rocourtiae TaxID=647910 RepID=UPI003CC6338B
MNSTFRLITKEWGLAKKKLMRALEDYAVENGCESIALVTDKDKPAFEFYKEFGLSSSRHTVFMFKSELN